MNHEPGAVPRWKHNDLLLTKWWFQQIYFTFFPRHSLNHLERSLNCRNNYQALPHSLLFKDVCNFLELFFNPYAILRLPYTTARAPLLKVLGSISLLTLFFFKVLFTRDWSNLKKKKARSNPNGVGVAADPSSDLRSDQSGDWANSSECSASQRPWHLAEKFLPD